jgi:IclR family acetate operon transcriptional repressor
MAGDAPLTSVSSVERASTVLRFFAESNNPTLGITEIANSLGLSKAVVHRVVSSLRDSDLLEADPASRRYRLGPMALTLGLAYLRHADLRGRARPILQKLSDATGETATLSLRHGWHRVYIDQVTPPNEVRMTVSIGRPFPLHAGSSSKAFLAFLPEAVQNEYLETQVLDAVTDKTITDRELLGKELRLITRRGYAKSAGERQRGAVSVAAPVFDHEGEVAGVISVCGPAERFAAHADEAAEPLMRGARELSRQLGFS